MGDGARRISFAMGGELSAISKTFSIIAGILLHSTNEKTEIEKLAYEVDFHPTHKADSGKLAREVDLGLARDNALVPDQKEYNDDVLAV